MDEKDRAELDAFLAYLRECDENAVKPNAADAFIAGLKARAALAATQAPEPMSVLTDKDIMKAAMDWREYDAPDEFGPVDRMVYGACRAVLAAYHAAL